MTLKAYNVYKYMYEKCTWHIKAKFIENYKIYKQKLVNTNCKMRGISWVAQDVLASQEALCSME
jgi:hypothetical protein